MLAPVELQRLFLEFEQVAPGQVGLLSGALNGRLLVVGNLRFKRRRAQCGLDAFLERGRAGWRSRASQWCRGCRGVAISRRESVIGKGAGGGRRFGVVALFLGQQRFGPGLVRVWRLRERASRQGIGFGQLVEVARECALLSFELGQFFIEIQVVQVEVVVDPLRVVLGSLSGPALGAAAAGAGACVGASARGLCCGCPLCGSCESACAALNTSRQAPQRTMPRAAVSWVLLTRKLVLQ